MVSRTEVKDIVYAELLNALEIEGDEQTGYTDGLVPYMNVGSQFPQTREDVPAVVYRDSYRPLPINGASASPHEVVRDGDGDVVAEVHREYVEAQFTFSVRAGNDETAETVYEAVHRHFHSYTFRDVRDVKGLHEDFFHIRVTETNYADDSEANVPMLGDTVQLNVHFYREYRLEGENMRTFEHDVEGNNYNTD